MRKLNAKLTPLIPTAPPAVLRTLRKKRSAVRLGLLQLMP